MTPSFAPGVESSQPGTVKVISHIYYPGTESDYGYDYSSYGMIYRTRQLRKMVASTMSVDPNTGVVNQNAVITDEGAVAATTTYNYPTGAASPLPDDMPTYTRRTDDWAGRTVGMPNTGEAPYYTFSNPNPTTSIVTAPDGTSTESETSTTGLVGKVMVKGRDGTTVLSETMTTWESNTGNPFAGPRIKEVKVKNEAGQSKRVSYYYGAGSGNPYNNVEEVREHDFDTSGGQEGTVLRRTKTTYVTDSRWIARRLVSLPLRVKVFDGAASVPGSRVDYEYDNYNPAQGGAALVRRDGITMLDKTYNPYAPDEYVCDYHGCPPLLFEGGETQSPNCDPPPEPTCIWRSPYNSATGYRGNVTRITKYPNAAAAPSPRRLRCTRHQYARRL